MAGRDCQTRQAQFRLIEAPSRANAARSSSSSTDDRDSATSATDLGSGAREAVGGFRRDSGAWERLRGQVAAHSGDALISHEFFHTWNVKRLKPAEFARYDYTRENYTPLLWFFEGFTSYYDDLVLVRAGLIDAKVQSLLTQGEIIAAAIASSATVDTDAITLDPEKLLKLAPGESTGVSDNSPQALEFSLNPERVGPLLRRLEAQGTNPVTICIAALRHFRTLHLIAADPNGINKARVIFKLREAVQRQAGQWGQHRLEQALALLVETDMTLRSSTKAPAMALMERALIRLAMMKR